MEASEESPQTSTGTDDVTLRSQQVLDKLAAMELQRRAEREKRREEAHDKQDPRENVKVLAIFTSFIRQTLTDMVLLLHVHASHAEPVHHSTHAFRCSFPLSLSDSQQQRSF